MATTTYKTYLLDVRPVAQYHGWICLVTSGGTIRGTCSAPSEAVALSAGKGFVDAIDSGDYSISPDVTLASLGIANHDEVTVDASGRVGINVVPGASSRGLRIFDNSGTALARVFWAEADGVSLALRLNALDGIATPGNTSNLWEVQLADSGGFGACLLTVPGAGFRLLVRSNGNATLLGTLTEGSHPSGKTARVAVDVAEIARKLQALPIDQYERTQDPGVKRVGPMSTDFRAAFGLGEDDTGIATLDLCGILAAGFQHLADRLDAAGVPEPPPRPPRPPVPDPPGGAP